MHLSKFSLLPRLLPAPQALIRFARPERLAPVSGKVVGSHSGSVRDQVNHVAAILHHGDNLPAYSIRCFTVTRNASSPRVPNKPPVSATSKGPLTLLSLLGCAFSITLIVMSVVYNDGMALLATILLSVLSTLVGIGSFWELKLPSRSATRFVPPSDVIISYPQGAFHIIKCDEYVARELYWAREHCKYYVGPQTYRFISLIGTLILMFGVIFLANARQIMQIAFAVAYILLNAAYWIVAALPPKLHWDLQSYNVKFDELEGQDSDNFTDTLWKAIAVTRSIEWVLIGNVAPRTAAWREWLHEALKMSESDREKRNWSKGKMKIPEWDCQRALTEAMAREGDCSGNV